MEDSTCSCLDQTCLRVQISIQAIMFQREITIKKFLAMNSYITTVVTERDLSSVNLFAATQNSMGILSNISHACLNSLADSVMLDEFKPDLTLLLNDDLMNMRSRIKQRNRPHEKDMPLDYLCALADEHTSTYKNNIIHCNNKSATEIAREILQTITTTLDESSSE